MNVAILYICTGRYNQFFPAFYDSINKYFLPLEKKHFFVWTDNINLDKGRENISIYSKKCEGFPYDSLFRFEMFLQAENELMKYDYIYFFNANSEIKQTIGEEILPDESGLVMGVWPGKREKQHPMFYPYERNKNSLAYVAPYGKNYTYFMGGINGGTSSAYIKMIRTLSNNIRIDYNNGIIAKVHDESHINAYLRKYPCKKLGREFCMPEEWIKEGETPKNIFRNKVTLDSYFNKGRKFNLKTRATKAFNILFNAIRWYLYI